MPFKKKIHSNYLLTVFRGNRWEGEVCVGNTGSIPRLGFRALCLQDSPLGVRFADWVSAFPAGMTTAATWDRNLMYQRGYAMGKEHKGKGIDIQLVSFPPLQPLP